MRLTQAWAVGQGLKVPSDVQLFLEFGTTAVRDYCVECGYLQTFAAVGAEVLQPACGACANCGPGTSTSDRQVTVSAVNRNFPGRFGQGKPGSPAPRRSRRARSPAKSSPFDELRGRVLGRAPQV